MPTWTVRHMDRPKDILGTVEGDTKDTAAYQAKLKWPRWAEKREHLFGFIITQPENSGAPYDTN
jgi:hypothetical protein